MFMMLYLHFSVQSFGALCQPLALDGLVASVPEYHLSDPIADLLPFANEVAGLFSAHYFRTFVFEDGDNRFRIGAFAVMLPVGDGSERRRHAVEVVVHLAPDALRPLHLVWSANQIQSDRATSGGRAVAPPSPSHR